MKKTIVIYFIFMSIALARISADNGNFINSVGMKMVHIDKGTFRMGEANSIPADLL